MYRISSVFAHVTNSIPVVPQSVGESIHGGHALGSLDGVHGQQRAQGTAGVTADSTPRGHSERGLATTCHVLHVVAVIFAAQDAGRVDTAGRS